jgi:L-galactose dehydrogenase
MHGGLMMEYKLLGNTELIVSRLGFGCSPFGDVYDTLDLVEAQRTVHMAIDEGINFFDVSPYYGITLAEERLGTMLAGKRHRIVLATKCGRYGFADFDYSAKAVIEGFDASLLRLQTDYVDLLQVHDVEFGTYEQIVEETLPALRQIQAAGKARYIGITGYPLGMLARIASSTQVDSVLTYCRHNLAIADMDNVLSPVVKRTGVGLINASPLHMGLLTERGAPDWHPAPPELKEIGHQAVQFARTRGFRLSTQALRFCLDHPDVASTLVGMSTRKHVALNLEALKSVSDKDIQLEIRDIFGRLFNYVWPSGRPENSDHKTYSKDGLKAEDTVELKG